MNNIESFRNTEENEISLFSKFIQSCKEVLFGAKTNLILICIPIAMIINTFAITTANAFLFALVSLIPLAERLGFVTENLALYTNNTIGGFLNATFGNATELIICSISLYNAKHQENTTFYLRVVQLSLLGSIISNILLVLGTAFLVGGIKNPLQRFNQEGSTVTNGMLIMAVTTILLPSSLSFTSTDVEIGKSELMLSRFESAFMLIIYVLYLVFQLCTHRHLYEEINTYDQIGEVTDDVSIMMLPAKVLSKKESFRQQPIIPETSLDQRTMTDEMQQVIDMPKIHTPPSRHNRPNEDYDDDGRPKVDLFSCILWLAIIIGFIAYLSEIVVGEIESASELLRIPPPFLCTIILPIVGNAAEHASAITFAYKKNMEISLGITIGSSTQIAVLVIPFTVLLAWIMGQDLDLNFNWFEAFVLFLAIMIMIITMNGGTSNWIKGVILVMSYAFMAAAFWVHNDEKLKEI